jgi:hypothetical protein
VPFAWDDYLANADRLLFLGIDPWRITHAVLGSAASTSIIDRLYTLWVPMVMVGVIVACLAKPVARAQYLLSFAVAWVVIGVVGAYLLSSAGPCYSHLIGTQAADWFAPLRERLIAQHAEVRLGAVGWQSTLWNSNVLHDYGFARGISATSMHNAICMLYVLALWSAGRAWRTLSCIYAGVIWVGSVHTGWHYAVDGLIAWAMMAAIWSGVGAYLRWCGYAAWPEPDAMEPAGELQPVFVRESAVA